MRERVHINIHIFLCLDVLKVMKWTNVFEKRSHCIPLFVIEGKRALLRWCKGGGVLERRWFFLWRVDKLQNTFNTSPSTRVVIVYWTTVTPPSGMPTNPSLVHLSANRITLPFCSCLLIGRNWNEKHLPSGQSNAGQTNWTLYYRTVLITWTGTCSGQRLMTT